MAMGLIPIFPYTFHLGALQFNPSDSKGPSGTPSAEWENCKKAFIMSLVLTDKREDFGAQRERQASPKQAGLQEVNSTEFQEDGAKGSEHRFETLRRKGKRGKGRERKKRIRDF